MPIDPALLAALISGGSAVAGTTIGAAAAGGQNKKSRMFSALMYEKQKRDNLEFWKLQNAYNDPSAAKARLKAAGLNPALLYGGSASGAAGVATSLDAPNPIRPEFNVPDFSGIGDAGRSVSGLIMSRYDVDIKEQTVENMTKQNQLLETQIQNAQIDANRKQFDLDLEIENRPTTIASRQAQLRKLEADIRFTLNSDDRAMLQNVISVSEGMERILTARVGREYTKSLMETEALKRGLLSADLRLRKENLSINDSIWVRLLHREIEGLIPSIRSAAQNVIDAANSPIIKVLRPKFTKKNTGAAGAGGRW